VYFLGKAFANHAFAGIDSSEQSDRLRIHPQCNQERLPWRESMLDTPVFRQSVVRVNGVEISLAEALQDSTLRLWVKKADEEADFGQVASRGNLPKIQPICEYIFHHFLDCVVCRISSVPSVFVNPLLDDPPAES
jgi:hypothetical protein